MATQELILVTFTTMLIAIMEPVSTNKISPVLSVVTWNQLYENSLPTFVAESPHSVMRRKGESYRLKCEVAGEPKFRITWRKDGQLFNSKIGNRSNVLINELTEKDAGVYTCHVCNERGCVISKTKIEVLKGESEDPMISYNNMEKHSQVSNSEVSSYYDEEEDGEDEVEDAVGGAGGDLPPGKPFFTKPDQLVSFMPKPWGNMVQLRCPAAGNPMPKITWTKNGSAIHRSMGSVKFAKWSIVLEDLVELDSGQYTCNVCNVHGCIHFTTTLKIKDRSPARPQIKEEHLVNTTVLVNTKAQLECRTVSDLEPHIEWIKFNVDVDNPVVPKNITKLQRDADNPEMLTLYNVTHKDEGWYTCVAANTLGSSFAKAYLRVVDEFPSDDIPTDHPVQHLTTMNTVMTIVLFGCFIIFTIIVVIICKKLKREKKKHRTIVNQWIKKVTVLKQPPIENRIPDVSDAMHMPIVHIENQRTTLVQNGNCDPTLMSEYEFPIDLNWEFPRSKLLLGKTLGEGAFGKVVLAEAQGLVKGEWSTVVAVKMLKEGHTDADVKDLVCEMEVMKMIGKHVNIINLLGCCCKNGPLNVIVEYAPHGNLKDFLRGHRIGTANDGISDKGKKILTHRGLIKFAHQIACGMEYLTSRRCIHRDLAARNVLVSDGYVMKIADFGLARDIHSQEYYRKTTTGKLPIRWMAPESLEERFYNSQSDVWSFGVLLWEIMTLGDNPYSSILTWESLLEHLKKGKRLERPPHCSIGIYLFMRECWHYRPEERPTFGEIVKHLDRLANITSNEEYLVRKPSLLETPPSSDDDREDSALDETDARHTEQLRMLSHHRK